MKLGMIYGVLVLLLLGLQWNTDAAGFSYPGKERKPDILLTDGLGRKLALPGKLKFDIKEIGTADSLFGSFFGLEPHKRYSIYVMRSDGKEISVSNLNSDNNGTISTCALWWDIGLVYDEKEGEKKIDPELHKYTYNCVISQANKKILEVPIPISKSTGNAYIYTCDENGKPKNKFRMNEDDVYLAARNLEQIDEDKLFIYVHRDRWTWRTGDKLDAAKHFKGFIVKLLEKNQEKFTQLIWSRDNLVAGSYDVIVSLKSFGILFKNDLIDDGYGVGFKVIDPNAESTQGKKARQMELVCQAPPRFEMVGALDEPHNPIYKDYFSPIEEIWVALESVSLDVETGKARIYVIQHNKNKVLKDGNALIDVSGGYEEVILLPGCTHAMYTRVWDSPEIREDGYDVVIDFINSSSQYGTYDEGLDILDSGVKGGFYVPAKWVCLESVSFNHTPNSIGNDALSIRISRETPVRVPEWRRGKKAFPAVYVKNSRIAVKPGFTSSENIQNATLKAYTRSGNIGDIKAERILFSQDTNTSHINTSNYSYFQVIINTPAKIQSFYQQWQWYLSSVNDSQYKEGIYIGTSINKIYIVLGVPQYPWTIEKETAPWTDILDFSGQVANGENTPEAAAQKITQFLYEDVGAIYNKSDHPYSINNDPYSDFRLTQFHNKIPNVGSLNCYDMGKALVTYANVLGCNLTLRYCDTFGDLNCIKSAGNDWDCNICFENHAFASIGDNIFDASLKTNSWVNPGERPYRESWMINVPWHDYKEIVVKSAHPHCPRRPPYPPCPTQPPYPQISIFKIEN